MKLLQDTPIDIDRLAMDKQWEIVNKTGNPNSFGYVKAGDRLTVLVDISSDEPRIVIIVKGGLSSVSVEGNSMLDLRNACRIAGVDL